MTSRISRGRGRKSKRGRGRGRGSSLRSHRAGVPRTQTSIRRGAGRVARKLRNQANAAKLSGNAWRYVEDADEETNSKKYLENYTKALFDLARQEDVEGVSTPAKFKLEDGEDAGVDVTGELDMEELEEALAKLPFHECIDIDYERFPDLKPSTEKKKPLEKETRKKEGLRYVQPPDWLLPKQKAATKRVPKPAGDDIDALINKLSSDGKLSRTQPLEEVAGTTKSKSQVSETQNRDIGSYSPSVPHKSSGQDKPSSNSHHSPTLEQPPLAVRKEKSEPHKPSSAEIKSTEGNLHSKNTDSEVDTTCVTSLIDTTVLKPQFKQNSENQIDDELNDLLGF